MWRDEIDDPEFQDEICVNATFDNHEFYFQPITSRYNILNAVTGHEYKYKIGSNDEKRFYIVMQADPWNPKESCRLFFESPDQYEQTTGNKVSEKSRLRFLEYQKLFK